MRVLLAEDEVAMSRAVTAILTHNGYDVDAVYDGLEAVDHASTQAYDCMIFDIMMPRLDGFSALKRLRNMGNITPVIFLTAKSEVGDRIDGLDAGADDYLTKPFAMGELLARVHSLVRRSTARYTPTKLSFGSVSLNLDNYELKASTTVRLSRREARLMQMFMLNPEKLVSSKELLSHVWQDKANVEEDIVWVYICYLRGKLEAIGADITIDDQQRQYFILRRDRV